MASIRTTLMDAEWTNCDPNLLPQHCTSLDHQELIIPRPASQRGAAVISKHAEILAAQAYNLPASLKNYASNAFPKFTPNEVKVVNKSHLTKAFASVKWQAVIDKVALKFEKHMPTKL